ncbi:dimethylmenaquinone methyltransferase [Meridianimarinicoccus roseus]|uniref:Dimethylmenaquinone methyltransferase n=1 Tax=Meridianimarinicoccus roseus TaxID=2072018 RepID=A0A2V2LJJ0_9RHOB|nr:TraR/DksA C4-type zinc finger protein [Meridianimarinicoccus roseus]PWR04241.1 dimethylmenaquinone methyltransferase [Meridianimarinicoccus roseus]
MDITTREAALRTRRAELTRHMRIVENTLDETPPADWEDRASERQGDEVLESLGQADLAELKRIDAALARIASGSYGTCEGCGEAISDARLDLIPDTPFCKTCAR